MSILIIGEKPSVSRAISAVVGASSTKKGYTEGNGYIVSWCVGHLVGLKYPNDYGNGWDQKWSFSQLPMLPEKWQFCVTDSTKAQYNLLKSLMNRYDISEIICATDADREGECIFRYVYNMANCKKPVKRLWVSSLEESAIRKALTTMKPMSAYDNLFNAGYARARADWLVGMNGSRLFSVRYGGKLNIGRVQTPTLAMIVQRDAEVNGFVKQKYYTADLNCGEFILSSARIDDENAADSLVSACDGSTVTISSVKREVKTDKAPKLYDLTTLQREANKAFGYTAQQTLDYTQSLYEGKLVTYPRTDSQFLSDDMAQTALDVAKLCDTYFGFGISHTPDISKVINNSKVSGHHAIIPTSGIATADLSSLPSGEKNVLTLIATKLICAAAPAHKYEAVKLTGICNGTEFTATGRTVLEMGWKAYAKQSDKKNEEKALPAVSEGQTFTATANKGEHFTSPPKPYTEDTLLSAMERAGNEDYDEDTEKKGLGTPATRAATIEALVKNGYVERVGKQLRATDKGKELVTVVPDEVKSAKVKPFLETSVSYHAVVRDGKVAFAVDKENAPAFHRALENAVRETNMLRKMADLGLPMEQNIALSPVVHRLAVEDMQLDLADFFDSRYDEAQFGEMLSLVNAYIAQAPAERYGENSKLTDMLEAKSSFDRSIELSDFFSLHDFSDEQRAAITAMFVGDVTRGQIDSIDETFTAEDIQAYDEILHNALQESDIEDFLAEHAHSVQKQSDRDQALADAFASHKDMQLSGSGDDLTNFRLHYDTEINNGEGGYNLIADRTAAPLIKDMSMSVLSDDISFDTFKDFLSSHDLAFESVIDTIVPEKQATEEEVLFSQADLARFLAEHTLSSDEWEDMASPLFERGYLEKHQPSDKASFGYHLPEKELYALAERYHHGDDIRRELALGLMIHASDNIADKDKVEFVFEDGKISDRTFYYGENLRHTIVPPKAVEHVDTALEALTLSIAEKARVDFEYMSSLTGMTEDELKHDLVGEIFKIPHTENTYQTASEYLSGDIRAKLREAEEIAEYDADFNINVSALKQAMPEPLKAGDIDVKLGATWIDPKYYEQFMYELLQTPAYQRSDSPSARWNKSAIVGVEYSVHANSFHVSNKSADRSVLATQKYGTHKMNAYDIFEHLLNLQEPKVYKTIEVPDGLGDTKEKRVVDIDATRVVQRKADDIRKAFKAWIFKDPQRREAIVEKYNELFNSIRPREYDGSALSFPMMTSDIKLHDHQKNAIAHAMFGGNTLFAHCVGAGKTFEMIATAMESKRLGLCTKSLFAVPNHLTEQIGDDFQKLYPGANILVATKKDFKKENRQQLFAKIATGNYDAIIIGHSQLGKIPVSKERQVMTIQSQIDDILQGIEELKKSEGSKFQIKAMERTRKSLQKQLDKLEKAGQDDTLTFEQLGIDRLFVDEAHEFKNLFVATKLQNVAGISNSASQKALDLFLKCRYLDEKTGGKGVIFATGTPVDTP